MESRSNRPGRKPEDLRRLLRTQPEVVVEDEDDAVIDIEVPEAARQLVPVENLARLVGDRAIGRLHPELESAARPLPSACPMAFVHQQARQPRVEPGRVAESPDVSPRGDQRLLRGVLGKRLIVQDETGKPKQPVAGPAGQLVEGPGIAASSPIDQIQWNRPPDAGSG